jgi:hypothetical protein
MQDAKHGDFSNYDTGFTAYENGKHRRYELLFAVNGGAFALAKLLPDNIANALSKPAKPFLGGLSVDDVALGMIAFTVIMFVDIAAFGFGMRAWHYGISRKELWRPWKGVFTFIGFFVLFFLCTLLCGGWYFVQDILPYDWRVPLVLAASFVLCALAYGLFEMILKRRRCNAMTNSSAPH